MWKNLSSYRSLWRHKKNCGQQEGRCKLTTHQDTTNKYERARSPVINRVHSSPPVEDYLQIEQKKLDKLHDEFRKSTDTANNHAIQRFGNGKEKPNTFTEEEESLSSQASSSSENGSMINDLTIDEEMTMTRLQMKKKRKNKSQ